MGKPELLCFGPHSFVIQWSHIILHKLLASPSIIKKDNFYKQIIQLYYPNKELSEIRKTLVNFCLIGSPQIHIKLSLWVYIKQFFSDNWNLMECLQTRWKNHPFNLMTTWKHFTYTDRMCPCCPPQDTAITMLWSAIPITSLKSDALPASNRCCYLRCLYSRSSKLGHLTLKE